MKKSKTKNLYYWLGGLAALVLIIGVVVYNQGEQFQGMLRLSQAPKIANSSLRTPTAPALEPQVPLCTGYTYSEWGGWCKPAKTETGAVIGTTGTQSRTVLSKTPVNCKGDVKPILTQSCPLPVCENFTYSDWSSCSDDDINGIYTQKRTVISAMPLDCGGGKPVLTQSCTLSQEQVPQSVPASAVPVACTDYTPSEYTACEGNMQQRTITGTPAGCINTMGETQNHECIVEFSSSAEQLASPTFKKDNSGPQLPLGSSDLSLLKIKISVKGTGNMIFKSAYDSGLYLDITGNASNIIAYDCRMFDQDGKTITDLMPIPTPFNGVSTSTRFPFTSELVIPGGSSQTLDIRCDTSAAAPGDAITLTLSDVSYGTQITGGGFSDIMNNFYIGKVKDGLPVVGDTFLYTSN